MAVAGVCTSEAVAQRSGLDVTVTAKHSGGSAAASGRRCRPSFGVTVTANSCESPPPYNNRGTRFTLKQNDLALSPLLARLSGHFRPLITIPHIANGFAARWLP